MPNQLKLMGESLVNYSYSIVMVYDASESQPLVDWLPEHSNQGFARKEKSVLFSMIEQAGRGKLRVFDGWPEDLDGAARVIAVPLHAASGVIRIVGLEEYPYIERFVKVPAGHLMVVLLQNMDASDDRLNLSLFLDAQTFPSKSKVLKADKNLKSANSSPRNCCAEEVRNHL